MSVSRIEVLKAVFGGYYGYARYVAQKQIERARDEWPASQVVDAIDHAIGHAWEVFPAKLERAMRHLVEVNELGHDITVDDAHRAAVRFAVYDGVRATLGSCECRTTIQAIAHGEWRERLGKPVPQIGISACPVVECADDGLAAKLESIFPRNVRARQAMLLLADGMMPGAVAATLGVTDRSIRNWESTALAALAKV